jgi:glycosyltransferase involved in cell wall biosynthesis
MPWHNDARIHPSKPLLLCGPSNYLARQVAVADRVWFEGHCADVERCSAAADLFVLPTRYDPFANTCLEAMACGLPVLTTRANGAAELIRNGVNGYVLAASSTADTLADAVQSLLPYEPRAAMGEAAQRTAGDYPLARALKHTVQAYQAIVSQPPVAKSLTRTCTSSLRDKFSLGQEAYRSKTVDG